jgi:hypothetical protein
MDPDLKVPEVTDPGRSGTETLVKTIKTYAHHTHGFVSTCFLKEVFSVADGDDLLPFVNITNVEPNRNPFAGLTFASGATLSNPQVTPPAGATQESCEPPPVATSRTSTPIPAVPGSTTFFASSLPRTLALGKTKATGGRFVVPVVPCSSQSSVVSAGRATFLDPVDVTPGSSKSTSQVPAFVPDESFGEDDTLMMDDGSTVHSTEAEIVIQTQANLL